MCLPVLQKFWMIYLDPSNIATRHCQGCRGSACPLLKNEVNGGSHLNNGMGFRAEESMSRSQNPMTTRMALARDSRRPPRGSLPPSSESTRTPWQVGDAGSWHRPQRSSATRLLERTSSLAHILRLPSSYLCLFRETQQYPLFTTLEGLRACAKPQMGCSSGVAHDSNGEFAAGPSNRRSAPAIFRRCRVLRGDPERGRRVRGGELPKSVSTLSSPPVTITSGYTTR